MFAEVFKEATDALEVACHSFDVCQSANGSAKDEAIPTGEGALDLRLIFLYKGVHGIGSQEWKLLSRYTLTFTSVQRKLRKFSVTY